MTDKKDPLHNVTRPETDAHWDAIIEGAKKAHKTWVVSGPLVAIVTYWKAFMVMGGAIVAMNAEQIITWIEVYAGVGK